MTAYIFFSRNSSAQTINYGRNARVHVEPTLLVFYSILF